VTHSTPAQLLASAGVTVFERGWLSANNILIQGQGPTALIDSGYWTHAPQTLALVAQALGEHAPDLLLNTHLHSDHCGGNAALQARYPALRTHIPPGHAHCVAQWDAAALSYEPTGQHCPRFRHDALLQPGSHIQLGSHTWQIHAAEGHDPHAVLLFQPEHRLLVSADALWNNGFGVVFPELEGLSAFDDVARTLDLIEQLDPQLVIPGHGPLFQDVAAALQRARTKLHYFVQHPAKHQRHGLKVLVKYKMLEWQTARLDDLVDWGFNTPFLCAAMPGQGQDRAAGTAWLHTLLQELAHSQALALEAGVVRNI
jgi:glyoxylase-like metal-dependent hydrolase (beta-lactamase superfamily II)